MQTTGVSKQERKIEEMAKAVLDLHGALNPLSTKGAFRFAISECLKEHGYSDWKDVSRQIAATRKNFFDCIRAKAIPKITKMGFPEAKITALEKGLQSINQKYLGA